MERVGGGVKKTAESLKEHLPDPKKVFRKSDNWKEVKDRAGDELSDRAGDFAKEQFRNYLQSQINERKQEWQEKTEANARDVHAKAEKAKEQVQEKLLDFKENLADVKQRGQEIQSAVGDRSNGSKRLKGVQDIKGVSHIKSASTMKGPKDVKGLSHMKTYHS